MTPGRNDDFGLWQVRPDRRDAGEDVSFGTQVAIQGALNNHADFSGIDGHKMRHVFNLVMRSACYRRLAADRSMGSCNTPKDAQSNTPYSTQNACQQWKTYQYSLKTSDHQ